MCGRRTCVRTYRRTTRTAQEENAVRSRPWSRIATIVVATSLLLTPAVVALADDGKPDEGDKKESFVEALKGGKATVSLRYRFETVDQDNFDLKAYASTLRTTLSYGTRPYNGFRVVLQAENIADIGAEDDHNNAGAGDRGNGITDRPVVADPPGTEMLQAYVQYQRGDSTLRLGRQEVILDDARFVGNVGWRQHHQSFRAFVFANESVDRLRFIYSYIDRAYRITGAQLDVDTHLLNANYRIGDIGAITAYGYLLRFDATPLQRLDTNTLGVEFKGQSKVGAHGRVLYEAEYASQSDSGNNPTNIDADYIHLMAGGGYRQLGVRIGWERLGGSEAEGQFQTVLATLHAFNGWADKFLSTPNNGLEDLYFRLDGRSGPLRWSVTYHDFRAATGDAEYGTELDFVINYRAPWAQTFGLKGALYTAEDFSVDTDKIWLYTGYAF